MDHVTYGSLANAFAKSGQWEAAVKVLEEMRARPSLRPNNFVYCSVMSACNRSNQWTVALALLDQLLKKVRMCAGASRKERGEAVADLFCLWLNRMGWSPTCTRATRRSTRVPVAASGRRRSRSSPSPAASA